MINAMDAERIALFLTDTFRVQVSHHRVDLSTEDLLAFRQFAEELMQKYCDNRHLLTPEGKALD